MPTFSARLRSEQAERVYRDAGRNAPKVIARALNRAITSGRVVMARAVSSDVGLKVSTVREQFTISKATRDQLTARLTSTGKRIPLIEFKAKGPEPSRGRGRGVTAKLKGGPGRYPRAFIATMRSGHRGVFERSGVRRLPIHELKGPSLPYVFAKHLEEGLQRAGAALATNIEAELKYLLRA